MKKTHLIAVACQLPPRLALLSTPPPPLHKYGEDEGLQVEGIIWVWELCPPHPLKRSVTGVGPPPLHPQLWEACGISENWDRNLKIGYSPRSPQGFPPSLPATHVPPSPPPPPKKKYHGGEGGWSEEFTAFLNLMGDCMDLKLCNLGYTIQCRAK